MHRNRLAMRGGLGARMTLSYVAVTVSAVLLLEILSFGVFAALSLFGDRIQSRVAYTAQQYASGLSDRARSAPLTPDSIVSLGDTGAQGGAISLGGDGIIVPHIQGRTSTGPPLALAVLIAPNGRVLASSYPAGYPAGVVARRVFPASAPSVAAALAGVHPRGEIASTLFGRITRAAAPVWGSGRRPIGALYIQVSLMPLTALDVLQEALPLLSNGLILLIVIAPIGAVFGLLTTRGLVSRVRRLVTVTTAFATGDLSQRVAVTSGDEIGQLELDVNRMADHLAASIAQQRDLAAQNARLAERARLSRELHDAISQDLFSLNMLIGGLQTALPDDTPFHPQLSAMEETTDRVIREMRALLLELRPIALDKEGLVPALANLAVTYDGRLGVAVATDIEPVSLPSIAEDALWRIAQEGLSNAVRHGRADIITLGLRSHGECVELTIADNGVGFVEDTPQRGLGLRLMRERAEELGGSLTMQTVPGHGTRLCVCLPRG